MNRVGILAVTTVSLLTLGAALPAGKAFGQETGSASGRMILIICVAGHGW
jgi:hypothetical protein